MSDTPLRIALISGSKGQRELMEKTFPLFGGLGIVYKGQSLGTNFGELVRSRPDVVVVVTGSPNTFHYEIDPTFRKLHQRLPQTKIVVRTELNPLHEFVRQCSEGGTSIVGDQLDWHDVVDAVRRTAGGEQVIHFGSRLSGLETHRRIHRKEQEE